MTANSAKQLVQASQKLIQGKGFCVVDMDVIEFSGSDRVQFLQNFCTADIKALETGQGTEAFVLNVKGKTIGFGHLLMFEDRALYLTSSGQAESLISHFDRYIIREDVSLADQSRQWKLISLQESALDQISSHFTLEKPTRMLDHTMVAHGCHVVATDIFSSRDFLFMIPESELESTVQILVDAGLEQLDHAAFETARIHFGTPQFGAEISERNLPQELGRNERAISFTKGCYLGQETVARIDALGHVNQFLVQVRLEGSELPDSGSELSLDGKTVGRICSATHGPPLDQVTAFASNRGANAEAGTVLESPCGSAIVI